MGGGLEKSGQKMMSVSSPVMQLTTWLLYQQCFHTRTIHNYTTAPNGRTRNQIGHVVVNGKLKRSVRRDTRSYRGADSGSDHNLVITTVRLRRYAGDS